MEINVFVVTYVKDFWDDKMSFGGDVFFSKEEAINNAKSLQNQFMRSMMDYDDVIRENWKEGIDHYYGDNKQWYSYVQCETTDVEYLCEDSRSNRFWIKVVKK